jgi:YbbR domain-containing protein
MSVVIIRKNFGLKILAVALAIIGWAYFRFAASPALAARFDQQISVPITAVNLPMGYIAHFTEKEAVVTVSTKRGEAPVNPQEIRAVLDLSYKGAGVYNVPVQLVAPNIVVQSLSPASVSLSIERIDERNFSLSMHYNGSASNGVVVSDAHREPSSVIVHGPTSLLAQVNAVVLDIPLPPNPSALDAMVRPVPINSLGQEVTGLEVAPDLVRVRVHFVKGTGATGKP